MGGVGRAASASEDPATVLPSISLVAVRPAAAGNLELIGRSSTVVHRDLRAARLVGCCRCGHPRGSRHTRWVAAAEALTRCAIIALPHATRRVSCVLQHTYCIRCAS